MMRFWSVLAATAALAVCLGGCGGDNAYDGENGLISGGSDASETVLMLGQINTAVLVGDSNETLQRAVQSAAAIAALQAEQSAANLAAAQTDASALFEAWKRVEALYVAQKYDDAMIDIPSQIDYFNRGNTDIPAKLDEVFAANTPLESRLYQSATKSVTALEYTLFGHGEGADVNMTQRRADAAAVMIAYVQGYLRTVAAFYAASDAFTASGEEAVGILINQLIDSAYKLKESRIGDPAGFTNKYKDDPDAERFEYAKSGRSLQGMRAILDAQLSVLQEGLGQIASANAASGEAEALVALLQDAIAQVDAFAAPIEADPASAQSRTLYNTVNAIQTGYTALINALNFQQDIIEADGD